MKKLIIYLLTIVSFIACNDIPSSQFTLDCTITNATQGEMVCLIYPVKHEGIWYTQCDTAYINNGKCCFKGKVDDVVPASLVFANMDEFNIYITTSNIELRAERSTIYDYSISSLKIDDEIKEYNKFFAAINKKIYEKQHLIQRKSEEYATAHANNADNAQTLALEFYNLIEEYKAISPEWSAMAVKFINISYITRRRQWHPTPVLLSGKSHGRRSLVGCSPWGLEESDTTERLHFHFSFSCIGEGNGNPLQCCCLENPRDGGAW